MKLIFFSAPFEISLSRLEKGSWREVTDAGVLKLKRSLQAASDNSWKDLDDIENLRTGIKQDEYILVMPKNWVSSGIFFLFPVSLFKVTAGKNATSAWNPKNLFSRKSQELNSKFMLEKKGSMMMVTFLFFN